jgi:small nuclear ribonucleoprotein G
MPLSHKLEKGGPYMFQYLDKRVFVLLNGGRKVMGVLRGYDVRILLHLQQENN